ncbi:ASCH domain-containing protein [Paenibacillus oralis]|uniref:ASCH domain-containing protein n=1 Tax=Paenibacillus oralis TaxID=2490856 RepID=A0A3P3T9M4_9BACL|nr:ASCH domain-containing protein [Paenibacillus oralis]RRJ54717.1 ASCH domain-containing protein [Paenibacillus oralis]
MEKGLIVRDPWIEMLLSGFKTWEIRSKPTSIRGKIGLIKSGTKKIFGEINIIDCVEIPVTDFNRYFEFHHVQDISSFGYSKIFAWVMQNPIRYAEPKPYIHRPGCVVWVNFKDNRGQSEGDTKHVS